MMTNLIVEAVIVAFCVGGAFGALVTLQLQSPVKKAEARIQRQRIHK